MAMVALVACGSPVLAQEVCLPVKAHRAILADILELRGDPDKPESTGLRGRVGLLDTELGLQRAQVVDLRLAKDLAVQAKETAQGALTAAAAGQRRAEESRDAWYRAPALWLATGVLGSLVIALAVDKIQE